MSLSGVPSNRWPAATIASPLVHTVTAANPRAMASASPEPMNRPRMPKKAPLETVMLVPVRGPMIAVGNTASVPTAVPTAIDVDRLPEAQAEQDREGAEDDVRPGQVGAEKHRGQVARPGIAGLFGQVFDAGRSRPRRRGPRSTRRRAGRVLPS